MISFLYCSFRSRPLPRVFTDFDPEHSFAGYKTFSWVSDQPMLVEGERGPQPLVADRLKTAVKN